MSKILADFDSPPPAHLIPLGWSRDDVCNRDGAKIAADYWEDIGALEAAKWLRDWADLAPDEHERHRRRGPKNVIGWGRNTKFAKTQRARSERAACRQNPDIGHGYGLNGIY